jgi:recombination protein RecA
VIAGRVVRAKLPVWEVRVSGIDNVELFTQVIPMWGPRGQALVSGLADPELRRHRGSQRNYLPSCQIEPVLSYLHGRGLTAITAASIVGAGDPKGGLRQVLGHSRLRRDRVQRLADALDSVFLRSVLDEDVWYDRITSIGAPEWADVFDVEVDEHHTFVANDVVISNCASPFRQAEFDIMYGKGISREGSLIDMSVDLGIVKKSGAWFTYEGEQLGQGRENAKTFLIENPEVMMEISDKVLTAAGLKPAEGEEPIVSTASIDEPIGFSPADEEPIEID